MNHRTISILGFLAAVVALVYMIQAGILFSPYPPVIIIQVLSAALMIWARMTLGSRSFHAAANTTKGPLITTGPYRFVRHPIYAAVIYFVAASLIAHPRLRTLAAVAVVFGGLFLRMLMEERSLQETYGEEYDAYARRVRRIVPGIF